MHNGAHIKTFEAAMKKLTREACAARLAGQYRLARALDYDVMAFEKVCTALAGNDVVGAAYRFFARCDTTRALIPKKTKAFLTQSFPVKEKT